MPNRSEKRLSDFKVGAYRSVSAITLFLLIAVGSSAAEQKSPAASASSSTWKYDAGNARDILETCAACHGKSGEGGKQGAYPRLAGLNEVYLARQLRAFKTRSRINIPMYPYATERELPPDDVLDIARYLSQIELTTQMPVLDPKMGAYERLKIAQAVFNVPGVKGDIAQGAEIYQEECGECHGDEGWGDEDTPQLAGQHTYYLRVQIEKYRTGKRGSDDMDGLFDELNAGDLENLFAYLASRDD
ncbi:MAG: c-type cytochrome [bacterium]|nr:c-type cytochrome [bacterium]